MNLVAVVTQRGQKQVQRLYVGPCQSVVIGRSWSCDIIIDDEYVEAAHAKLYEDDQGDLCLEDLGTQNGTRVDKQPIETRLTLQSGARVKVGDTVVEIFDAEAEVVPAIKRSSGQNILRKFNSVGGVLVATLIASLAMLISIYGSSAEPASAENIVSAYAGLCAIVFGWSLLGGIVGKLFRGETNISSHWVFICVFFAIATVLNFLLEVLDFNLNSDSLSGNVETVVWTGLIALLCYGTFSLSTKLSAVKKAAFTSVLVLLPVSYALVSPMLEEKHESWSGWVNVNQSSQPPVFMFRTPTTLAIHQQATAALYVELEREVNSGVGPDGIDSVGEPDNAIQISGFE